MRRRSENHLVPNEERTLAAALALHQSGTKEFHGYLLAGQLKKQPSTQRVMAYSTLYRCLDRLQERGLVQSWWAPDNTGSGGPPRRLFSLTDKGTEAAKELPATPDGDGFGWKPSDN
jgi:DNA-binding PadR family transcriptional regulator